MSHKPTGRLLIRMAALERSVFRFGMEPNRALLGELDTFCDAARKGGFRICRDATLSHGPGHIDQRLYRMPPPGA